MQLLKSHLLDSWAMKKKTEEIVKMTKKWCTKIVKFITPTAGLLLLRPDHLRCIVRMHSFFKKPSSLQLGIAQTSSQSDSQGKNEN